MVARAGLGRASRQAVGRRAARALVPPWLAHAAPAAEAAPAVPVSPLQHPAVDTLLCTLGRLPALQLIEDVAPEQVGRHTLLTTAGASRHVQAQQAVGQQGALVLQGVAAAPKMTLLRSRHAGAGRGGAAPAHAGALV